MRAGNASLARLVELEERRDRREERAAELAEQKADDERKRAEAELQERSAWWAWARSTVTGPTVERGLWVLGGGLLSWLGLSSATCAPDTAEAPEPTRTPPAVHRPAPPPAFEP